MIMNKKLYTRGIVAFGIFQTGSTPMVYLQLDDGNLGY